MIPSGLSSWHPRLDNGREKTASELLERDAPVSQQLGVAQADDSPTHDNQVKALIGALNHPLLLLHPPQAQRQYYRFPQSKRANSPVIVPKWSNSALVFPLDGRKMDGGALLGEEMAMTRLQQATIDTFRGQVGGPVFEPSDAGYDAARQIWNAMIDRKPALIAQCHSAEDVMAAVNFGRDQSMLVSVKGGGHNIAGNAVCDEGLMIDLSQMKDVEVDVEKQRAYVGPGCTLADFDAAAQVYGLATPLGINSTTGVAGLTLGGGFGWLSRKHGMTVDNLLSADMVTANGRQIHASATENPDLFWGTRGGGGNFGIVTRFEFQLHPVGPGVLSGLMVFPFNQARSVMTQFARFTEMMPDELNVWLVIRHAPPLPFLPESVHGEPIVALAICYAGDPEVGEELIAPLRSFGDAHGEHVGVQPYASWQQAFDPLLADGARNYWKSHNFVKLTDDVIRVALEFGKKLPSPHCEIFIASIGGEAGRVAHDAMAYSNRDANYVMNVHGRWETPGEDEHCRQWARGFFEAAKPYASDGAYINFLSHDESDRVEFAYGGAYKRLVEVKQKYDPENLFRVNQNIRP